MKKTLKWLSAKLGDASRVTSVQAGSREKLIVQIAISYALQLLLPWLNVER
jgi:hypothetical protein